MWFFLKLVPPTIQIELFDKPSNEIASFLTMRYKKNIIHQTQK